MAGGVNDVRTWRGGGVERVLQRGPRGAEGARDIGEVERVARGVEVVTDPCGAGVLGGEVAEQLDEHTEVVGELAQLALHHDQLGAREAEERLTLGFGHEERPGVRTERWLRVRGRLHVEVDDLAAGGPALQPVPPVVR